MQFNFLTVLSLCTASNKIGNALHDPMKLQRVPKKSAIKDIIVLGLLRQIAIVVAQMTVFVDFYCWRFEVLPVWYAPVLILLLLYYSQSTFPRPDPRQTLLAPSATFSFCNPIGSCWKHQKQYFNDFEIEWFCGLSKDDATDPVNGVQSAIGKTLSGKCMMYMTFMVCCSFIDILTLISFHPFSSK